ncbi:MAG: hypothetical protein ABIH23_12440, partial [bacterium]
VKDIALPWNAGVIRLWVLSVTPTALFGHNVDSANQYDSFFDTQLRCVDITVAQRADSIQVAFCFKERVDLWIVEDRNDEQH